MYELMPTQDILKDISIKIKKVRLSLNLTQEDFALKVGIPLSTYRSFEREAKGSFENFIKITTTLGRINEIENILKTDDFSPSKAFYNNTKNKQRASKTTYNSTLSQLLDTNQDNFMDTIRKHYEETKSTRS